MDRSKIVMLGTTGSGKTCYMLAMYASMQIGRNGFTFSATDLDMDLELSNRWETLVEGGGSDRWPPPTNQGDSKKYTFSLNYAFNPLMEFEWFDYRGGAMSDQESEEDVSKLIKEISDSSCLLICVSGKHLKEKVNSSTRIKVKADRINAFINRLSAEKKPDHDNPFPVAIVITKYELCKERTKKDVIDDIKTMFQALFVDRANFLVMICPVSLGQELAEDDGDGKIAPLNVELPVIFAICFKFIEYVKLEKNIEEIELNFNRLYQELQGTDIYLNGKTEEEMDD